jgi:Transglutaminase-like enzymes, putative cysteine proteases
MSTLADIGAVLQISTLPDWKYVSSWYSDLSSSLAKTDFVIKEAVSELFKDKKNLTEIQKAKMIYEYIEQNVTYSNVPFMHGPIIPQKASRTLTTKLGDCKDVSTLFVAMCKEAGLKANLVLVDTRDNGDEHLDLPSIDFNHCIAQLTTGNKTYFIELTDQRLSFASLPITDINANALFIPRDDDAPGESLIKLNNANRVLNQIIRETEVKFENNDLLLCRKNIKTGALASQMRSDYADLGKEKQEKQITQAVASDFTNPTKLLALQFDDLKSLADSVK